jgi:hypothetical protein
MKTKQNKAKKIKKQDLKGIIQYIEAKFWNVIQKIEDIVN